MLEILKTMRSRNGIKKIQTQYRIMVNRPNIKLWAKEFQGQIIAFDENSADFEPENLRELFKFYFNSKECQILICRSIVIKSSNSVIPV